MIKHIDSVRKTDLIGTKARSLRYLKRMKFRIPKTLVLTEATRINFRKDPDRTERQLQEELQTVIEPAKSYAIRSSSEMEDRSDYSFAGQFKTLLNIEGAKNVLKAIKSVWQSAGQVEESEYFRKISHKKDGFGMGIIIQEMVKSAWSGVAFSINPVTGRDEIIIEGVKGGGEELVQKGDNPYRWKYIQGALEDFEESDSPGKVQLGQLVRGIQMLRKHCKTEVDIEWAFDGNEMYYLQCRSVTSQKYPTLYANHISREVLPGMIKPLVWSVNIPLVNGAWIRLLKGMLGPLDIVPEQLSRSFYYRAYFNMGTLGALFQMMGLPGNSLESLMGRKDPSGNSAFRPTLKTIRYLPRMTCFLISNLSLGRRFERKIVELEKGFNTIRKKLDEGFAIEQYPEIFRQIREMAGEAAYYNIIIPLTMQILNRLLKHRMEKRKLAYEEIDFFKDFPLLRDYDPKYHIRRSHELWMNLPTKLRKSATKYTDLMNLPDHNVKLDLQNEVGILLEKFGHFSESGNDFSYPSWEEDPEFVFSMIRQPGVIDSEKSASHGREKTGHKKQKPGAAYHRAGKYRLYREMISSEYTRGYGLFRKLFLKTGAHLSGTGKVSAPEDVFLLTLEEHDQLLQDADASMIGSLRKEILKRKQEMLDCEHILLPSVIYGDETPPLARPDQKILHGIPASPGLYEGEIVVVRGYKDFDKPVEGAIMVIPFSDVGWTPILTRAGAVVSESGGMLSHASIVARELTIPAIVSVDHACSLEEGKRARLDGYNGVLIIDS